VKRIQKQCSHEEKKEKGHLCVAQIERDGRGFPNLAIHHDSLGAETAKGDVRMESGRKRPLEFLFREGGLHR